MQRIKSIGMGLLVLTVSLLLTPLSDPHPVRALSTIQGDAMVHWYQLTHENLVDLGHGLLYTGAYIAGTKALIDTTIGLCAPPHGLITCGFSIAGSVRAIVAGTPPYIKLMKQLHGLGARGDDILYAGERIQGTDGRPCTISDVNVQLLDHDYNVISTGKATSHSTGFPLFATFGARLDNSRPGTSDPIVKIHWWYDTGVAVRYRPIYTVDRAGCTITGAPEIHALDTSTEPSPIKAGQPTSIIVHTTDHVSRNPISGKVFINNVEVGDTNTAFTYTFNSRMPGTVKASSYPDTTVYFNIIRPLSVSANPNETELNKPVQVTISATDPVTHAPVAGKVMSNEGSNSIKQIGTTNTQFTHTFTPHFTVRVRIGAFPSYPTITVVAPDYDNTRVGIKFTGQLPEP
jgi:hypothetical protein